MKELLEYIESKFPEWTVSIKNVPNKQDFYYYVFYNTSNDSIEFKMCLAVCRSKIYFAYGRIGAEDNFIELPTRDKYYLIRRIRQLADRIAWCADYFNPTANVSVRLDHLWSYFLNNNGITKSYVFNINHNIGKDNFVIPGAIVCEGNLYKVTIRINGNSEVTLVSSMPIGLIKQCQDLLRTYYFRADMYYTNLIESRYAYDLL